MATYKVIFPTCGCGQIKAFECAVGTTRHDGVSLPSANSWQLRSLRKTLDLICFVLTYFESVPEGFCQGFGKQSIDSSLANHPNKTWSTVVLSPPIHKRPTSVNEEKKKVWELNKCQAAACLPSGKVQRMFLRFTVSLLSPCSSRELFSNLITACVDSIEGLTTANGDIPCAFSFALQH